MSTKVHTKKPNRYFINNLPEYQDTGSFSPDIAFLKTEILDKAHLCATKQSVNITDGGLYVGSAGIGYMFYHISKSNEFVNEKNELLKKCLDIMNENVRKAKKSKRAETSDLCGFLLGNAGIYAVSAAVCHALDQKNEAEQHLESYKKAGSICTPLNYAKFGGDELFVGRAGYICGAVWLNKEFGKEVIPEKMIEDTCLSLIESGKRYAKNHHMKCPLMYSYYGTEYLGAAHGLCSILQMLLSCDLFLSKYPEAEKLVKQSVDFLLSLQTENGNFPCALDEIGSNARSEENELIHWCHGAPGTVYLMSKAYLRWKDDKYLNSALQCGEVTWNKGLLRKGPGICHGVAGSGYVFLLLYRLTGDNMHLHRANEFAKFLLTDKEFLENSRTPDMPYSLYEGYAGTVCFLTDLMNPTSAAFPFMDVF